MIAHVVLFDPKPGLSVNQRQAFLRDIRSTAKITGAVDVSYVGRTIALSRAPTDESGQTTYSFAAVLMFSDRHAFEAYLKHPAHDDLRETFWRLCGATFIADLDLVDLESDDAELLVE